MLNNNVQTIVENYLRDNGYEGLCNPMRDCKCSLGDYLIHCDNKDISGCEPGNRKDEEERANCGVCEPEGYDSCDCIVVTRKSQ